MNPLPDNPALEAFAEHLRVLAGRSRPRTSPVDREAEPCLIHKSVSEVTP